MSCGKHRNFLRKKLDPAALGDLLRRLRPLKTAATISAETGLSLRTVENLIGSNPSLPGLRTLLALVDAYGPEVLAALYVQPPAWMDAAARAAIRANFEHERAAARRRRAEQDGRGGTDFKAGVFTW
ncbi:hypothetical protein [Breoghania sp.]|uniref:hypothetical protein n=1 Tax=Breoghania sp. TaxID=2065378 RepID=UPI002AABDAAA|nr:hypothetical protein [Breoghania sp.]